MNLGPRFTALFLGLGAVCALFNPSFAGHCGPLGGCSGDVVNIYGEPIPDGIVGLSDVTWFQYNCISYYGGDERCDVNCDGLFSGCDISIFARMAQTTSNNPAFCDEIVCGACCVADTSGGNHCDVTTHTACSSAGGVYYGNGSICEGVTIALVEEPGGQVFTHHVGPQHSGSGITGCPGQSGIARVSSIPSIASVAAAGPPYFDAWISDVNATMCHRFGVGPESPPIPADFFGPGSLAFSGQVCLRGAPLGGPYGSVDTIIERTLDPFDRCTLPGSDSSAVGIQIVELNLVSTYPITVEYDGGPSEDWDVAVDLSEIPSPMGTLTARKTHCNGGTYTSELPVRPRFTFTKISDPGQVVVLDTGLQGIDPVLLDQQNPQPWATYVGTSAGQLSPDSDFHAGFTAINQGTACDENMNGVHDYCDKLGVEADPVGSMHTLHATPNPFRSQTSIQFELDTDRNTQVRVFDMAGRQVRTLHSGRLPAGTRSIQWDGDDDRGQRVPSGIYVIRVEAGSLVREGKVLKVE